MEDKINLETLNILESESVKKADKLIELNVNSLGAVKGAVASQAIGERMLASAIVVQAELLDGKIDEVVESAIEKLRKQTSFLYEDFQRKKSGGRSD